MTASNRNVVILIGPPGAGKGTQAELLSEKLNLQHVETSKLLEEKFKDAKSGQFLETNGEKYFLLEEKKLWETGVLCSPPFATLIMLEKFQEVASQGKSLLLSGSPRTLYECAEEIPLLEKLYGGENIHVILLELSEAKSIIRNSNRRICELMRHPVWYNPETMHLTVCPLDGSALLKREGLDDPETIKVRLKEYAQRTVPVIAYFQEHGLKVKKVDADQSVAKVFQDILGILGA